MNDKWLYSIEDSHHKEIRLFFFPFTGGGMAAYRRWAKDFDDNIKLSYFCYPGRESRLHEPCITDFKDLINELYKVIINHLDYPYAFYGHSHGALVAYALAEKLIDNNQPLPVRLFLSARRAPHIIDTLSKIAQLPEQQFIQAIIDRYQGIPEFILKDRNLLKIFVNILRQDFILYENYCYIPHLPLPMPMSIFGFENDKPTIEQLKSWQTQSTLPIEFVLLPGEHFSILNDWHGLVNRINLTIAS